MNEGQLIHKLKEEQVRFALLAMQQPSNKDAFEYGHRVGFYAGLEKALAIITASLKDENAKEF